MKKALLIMSLLAVGMVVGVPQATAQEEITVTVTVPTLLSVTLDTDSWPIGDVTLGQTVTSDTIRATNNGNVAETFTIVSGNSVIDPGPPPVQGWTCGAPAGSETFAMEAQGGDLSSYTSICGTAQTLETPVAKDAFVDFTLRFTAPSATAYVDTQHTITVTVTASAST